MYVYILQSKKDHKQRYVGLTSDLKSRIQKHNQGQVTHTRKFLPWKIRTALWFECKERAALFEKYLKNGSGRAFIEKHL